MLLSISHSKMMVAVLHTTKSQFSIFSRRYLIVDMFVVSQNKWQTYCQP